MSDLRLSAPRQTTAIVTGSPASGKLSADCALEAKAQAAVGSCPASEMPPTPRKTAMNEQRPIRRNRPTFTDQEALQFHSQGRPGKLEVVATKPMSTQRDLSLAYSPGVAVPVLAIAEDPALAYDYKAKGNMVGVVSNGTAILGLGNRGALASKPVMEGKAVLFKRFADIDAFDLEVGTEDPDEVINCVRYLGPTFGGINLEDIKAPECFICLLYTSPSPRD